MTNNPSKDDFNIKNKHLQTLFNLLKTNNEYWIIKNSKYEGLVYYYVILY